MMRCGATAGSEMQPAYNIASALHRPLVSGVHRNIAGS